MANTPVLVIAEPGFDAKTCTDDQKVFDSRLKTLKTKAAVTIAPNGSHYSHGLGYTPIYLYAGYLSAKPTYIGFIGQNTLDNLAYVVANSSEISNDNMSTWAASALIYVFWEQLS